MRMMKVVYRRKKRGKRKRNEWMKKEVKQKKNERKKRSLSFDEVRSLRSFRTLL